MSARAELRAAETRWSHDAGRRPITRIEILHAAYRENPALARRLAAACRAQARRRHADAQAAPTESLERAERMVAAELEAAADVLDTLAR